jgi:hypothetical protein
MTASPTQPFIGGATKILQAGVSVVAVYGPCVSGRLYNGFTLDQGLNIGEALYYSYIGPAGLAAGRGTFVLQAGETVHFPPGLQSNVWVNAKTAGHEFTAVTIQAPVPYPPISNNDTFPPLGPVTRQKTIPSYVYQQYNDDDSLVAFANAYNNGTQAYIDWFNDVDLPVYTQLLGTLLDWVGAGLYGMARPTLSSGNKKVRGPLNTYALNVMALNASKTLSNYQVSSVNDDVYKRILTWHLFKGDGKYFTVQWLKRRIYRFLYGVNGTDAVAPFTNQISVTFGTNNQIDITIITGTRSLTTNSALNSLHRDRTGQAFTLNSRTYNQGNTLFQYVAPPPLANVFKEALNCGVLEFPFQYTPVVVVGT